MSYDSDYNIQVKNGVFLSYSVDSTSAIFHAHLILMMH